MYYTVSGIKYPVSYFQKVDVIWQICAWSSERWSHCCGEYFRYWERRNSWFPYNFKHSSYWWWPVWMHCNKWGKLLGYNCLLFIMLTYIHIFITSLRMQKTYNTQFTIDLDCFCLHTWIGSLQNPQIWESQISSCERHIENVFSWQDILLWL